MDNFLTTEQADEIFYASVEGLTLDVDDYEFDAETSAHIYIDEVFQYPLPKSLADMV